MWEKKKKSPWELWWKKGDMPQQISKSFTSLKKKKKKREKWTHTHKSQPGLRMMSHVFVVLFYPLQDMGRGVRAAGHTHTHSCLLQLCSQCANHGSRRQPSFSCQGWKQNRWEMKCWDWPDLVDDCRLNSWGWNWAFYTLAAAQDTICPNTVLRSMPRRIPVSWELSYSTVIIRKWHQMSSD